MIDLFSRRLLGAATSLHPDAELACAAIQMAVATRGGKDAIWREEEAERVIFHTDSEYGGAGSPGLSDSHADGRVRMLVPGRSRAS